VIYALVDSNAVTDHPCRHLTDERRSDRGAQLREGWAVSGHDRGNEDLNSGWEPTGIEVNMIIDGTKIG